MRRRQKKVIWVLWMAVTADKYELPLAVEDTQEKLAKKLGITKGGVGKIAYLCKHGGYGARRTAKYRIYGVEE